MSNETTPIPSSEAPLGTILTFMMVDTDSHAATICGFVDPTINIKLPHLLHSGKNYTFHYPDGHYLQYPTNPLKITGSSGIFTILRDGYALTNATVTYENDSSRSGGTFYITPLMGMTIQEEGHPEYILNHKTKAEQDAART